MNEFWTFWAYPWVWLLLSALPLFGWLVKQTEGDRLRLAGKLAGLAGMQVVHRSRRNWRAGCLVLSALVIIVASAGPQWGRDPKQPLARGRDLIIALDISRSMLAEDRADFTGGRLMSRLERAKGYLAEFLEVVTRRSGHRIGLVWFAGQARLVCPLTDDYDHIRTMVALAHPDYWGPAGRLAMTEHGAIGTSLREAIQLSWRAHDPQAKGFQDILLITDGDDQDSDPAGLVQQIQTQGIRVHILGVGREQPPALIPSYEPGRWLEINGQPITTRRRDAILAQLARMGGGQYLAEEDYAQPLASWYLDYLERQPQREWSPMGLPRPQQQSHIFFAIALVLLLIAWL
ncbi:MAG: VWA domain-containing protein [Gemmatales bacterium]|nr:VWA domain-containing protein [Gemmatales bacterium]MCS7161375.1 VWA domain-containing protein [Gemmatales bacterium]MDW8176578.1 VWA domain-containing protein [Gemmatales bacterium]MDW8223784.1 VWA domain-containing protein [Gemmatales bacterium]